MLAPYYHKPRKGSLRPRIKSKRGQVIERHSAGELKDVVVVGQMTSGTQNSTPALSHPGSIQGFHWRQVRLSVVVFASSAIYCNDIEKWAARAPCMFFLALTHSPKLTDVAE